MVKDEKCYRARGYTTVCTHKHITHLLQSNCINNVMFDFCIVFIFI